MPRFLSALDRTAFARRLSDYVNDAALARCAIIFHGGEPLLAGVDVLTAFARELRTATHAKLDIGLQTNGLLLTDSVLAALEEAEISVSLSLDGPRHANDRHRITRKGRSSFDKTFAALNRLARRPKTYAGIIAVIDPGVSPQDLFEFFEAQRPPRLDFLLPDAHHLRPPMGRERNLGLYRDWLIEAFDLWLDRFPHLAVRTFEALLDSISGMPSHTDAFGFGDVSLITIETDGTYHDLDVFKVTRDGATKLEGSVRDTSIAEVAASGQIAEHRRSLQKDGLCSKCRACPVVDTCGGGSLPHRYGENGLNNPTVYCEEMLALIQHARARVRSMLSAPMPLARGLHAHVDLGQFEIAEKASDIVLELCAQARGELRDEFLSALHKIEGSELHVQGITTLDADKRTELCSQPGSVAWQRAISAQAAGRLVHSVDGTPLNADASYLGFLLNRAEQPLNRIAVGLDDLWLRLPFGKAICFEDEDLASRARPLVDEALAIIDEWRSALGQELRHACRAIQFVRDPLADPAKIVSFSDNTVPGALYVSVVQGDQLIDAYDLADSLIHEHRHQKLYLLERLVPMVEQTSMKVVSPWREDLRPPSGLLHAVFVFAELRRYWKFVRECGPTRLHNRAVNQLEETERHLGMAFRTLADCPLTEAGRELTSVLKLACEHELKVAA